MSKISDSQHVVIIGMGVAGVTFAKHLRKVCNCRITLISDEHFTHFSRPALMYVYLGHMRRQDIEPYEEWWWKENRLTRISGTVTQIDVKRKAVILKDQEPVLYNTLVIASGSVPKFYNWPGQELKGVQGFVRLADLQLLEENTTNVKEAVIIGGGLIGVELAEMLHSRKIQVSMLVRENLYWNSVLPKEEAEIVTRHLQKKGINLIFNDELSKILADESGRVKEIKTKSGKNIKCQFAGIATGVQPNIRFLENAAIETDTGILVDRYFCTSQEGVYAIGDCAQFREPENNASGIEQLWYTARMHGESLARNLAGNPGKYFRKTWFNSAKFIDIEYQTYGKVPAKSSEELVHLVWQDIYQEKLIRIVYDQQDFSFVGINSLGIRLRHDLLHDWLEKKARITEVLKKIEAASFQPEFTKSYVSHLVEQFNSRNPEQAIVQEKTSWWQLRKKLSVKN